MVVDDMDFILDFTRSFLSAAGYDVQVALGADAAMSALEPANGEVDMLLTDHNMPNFTGADLIKAAKARWPRGAV